MIARSGLVDDLSDDRLFFADRSSATVLSDQHLFVERLLQQRCRVFGAARATLGIAGASLLEPSVPRGPSVADGVVRVMFVRHRLSSIGIHSAGDVLVRDLGFSDLKMSYSRAGAEFRQNLGRSRRVPL